MRHSTFPQRFYLLLHTPTRHFAAGISPRSWFDISAVISRYYLKPDRVKQGPRADAKSPAHGVRYSEFTRSPELCATCHDEQSPYGAWVKTTYEAIENCNLHGRWISDPVTVAII